MKPLIIQLLHPPQLLSLLGRLLNLLLRPSHLGVQEPHPVTEKRAVALNLTTHVFDLPIGQGFLIQFHYVVWESRKLSWLLLDVLPDCQLLIEIYTLRYRLLGIQRHGPDASNRHGISKHATVLRCLSRTVLKTTTAIIPITAHFNLTTAIPTVPRRKNIPRNDFIHGAPTSQFLGWPQCTFETATAGIVGTQPILFYQLAAHVIRCVLIVWCVVLINWVHFVAIGHRNRSRLILMPKGLIGWFDKFGHLADTLYMLVNFPIILLVYPPSFTKPLTTGLHPMWPLFVPVYQIPTFTLQLWHFLLIFGQRMCQWGGGCGVAAGETVKVVIVFCGLWRSRVVLIVGGEVTALESRLWSGSLVASETVGFPLAAPVVLKHGSVPLMALFAAWVFGIQFGEAAETRLIMISQLDIR